jgi:hypothetical protein
MRCMEEEIYDLDGRRYLAQWAKAPGMHCYVADSIPAVTPIHCTNKTKKLIEAPKIKIKWVTAVAQWAGQSARHALLYCGFDSRRHIQILYE